MPPWIGHLQSFTPSKNRLDAVQVLLRPKGAAPILTTIKVSIWNQIPTQGVNPLGTLLMTIAPRVPTWYQFDFDPWINLKAGNLYYISVAELRASATVQWCYRDSDVYPFGQGFLELGNYIFYPEVIDFTFKTEYYIEDGVRVGGHYLTCAGVNSQDFKIGVSDPYLDILNPTPGYTKHNDPQYVSHDIYDVTIGCPCPNLDYKWWLSNYPGNCSHTIVEQAVVICPLNNPPNTPSKPSGPTTGVTGVEYQYTTSATDPDPGDQIKYGWDFDNDGIVKPEHWTGYYASGATCPVGITFISPGIYYLSVIAMDNKGAQSAFSSVLTVVISPGTNNPPTVSITSPSSGAAVSGIINI